MFTDLVVLVLTLVGLLITPGRSQLWRLLLGDGILYFLVAFVANAIPAVFLLLNLNPVMNIVREFFRWILSLSLWLTSIFVVLALI